MAAVLVADDSIVTRRLLSHVLSAHGHAAVGATNGQHALEILSEARFDIVTADLAMPEMDGIALLKHHKHPWWNRSQRTQPPQKH